MSTSSPPGYREGIWEINVDTITVHDPAGAWTLHASELDSVRLQYGFEKGTPICDAFLKERSNTHSHPLGRYEKGNDRFCEELALFAARNHIVLHGMPISSESSTPSSEGAALTGHPGSNAPSAHATQAPRQTMNGRQSLPKSPDSPFQFQQAPPAGDTTRQGFTPNQDFGSNQGFTPNQNFDPNQGFHPNQNYDPNQGFNPNQNYDPNQGFHPNQGPDFQSGGPWKWAFNKQNPAYRRNVLLAILGSAFLVGLGFAMMAGGIRSPIVTSPWVFIAIFWIIRGKKGKGRRH